MFLDDQKKYLMTKLGLSGFYGMNDLISLYLKDRLGSDYDSVGQHEFFFRRPFTNTLRTVSDQLFFTGDGSTNSAELTMPDGSSVDDKYLRSLHIHQTDWQGRVELSDQPRTNYNYPSAGDIFSSNIWFNNNSHATVTTQIADPHGGTDAVLVKPTTGYETSTTSGFFSSASHFGIDDTTPYYLSAWLRTDAPSEVRFGPNGGSVPVTDQWARYATLVPAGGDCIVYNGNTKNTGVEVYGLMASVAPGAYIPTTTAPVTVTDYTRSGSTITFGQTPAEGATEEWSGSVYNHPITIESRKGTPLSDLVVEQIVHKEGEDEYTVLTQGTDYTVSGETVTIDPSFKPTDCFYTGYAK